jgi:transcription initiation factor TFIIIB Brf1 subunit/transcription initiation factor TFIIB
MHNTRQCPGVATCPDCGTTMRLDARRAELVCDRCGLVLHAHEADQVDRRPQPEPRAPPPKSQDARIAALERRHKGMTGSEHRWLKARDEARRLAATLGCPLDTAERAGLLLRKARDAGLTQGRDLDAMAAAALLASCRMLQLVRKDLEVADASPATAKDIKNAYKALVTGLRLQIPTTMAYDHLAAATSALGLPAPVQAKARELLEAVCGTERAAGKNPRGWAAAGIIKAAQAQGIPVKRSDVARVTGVSLSTIKARVDELEQTLQPNDDGSTLPDR